MVFVAFADLLPVDFCSQGLLFSTGNENAPMPQPKSILIVDGDPEVASLLERTLRRDE
jgi:hypothetical protein